MIRIVGLREENGVMIKWCPSCKQDKAPEAFARSVGRKDGLNGHCRVCHSHKHRKTKYDLTIEEYEVLYLSQEGKCKLCGKPPRGKPLSVDHCHETGRVRGLLCIPCNRVMGYLDNFDWFRRALMYQAGQL